MVEVGDRVTWETKDEIISGTVLRVYETTFGAKKRGVALQIKLDEKRKGRIVTTFKASNCEVVEKPRKGGKKIVPDGTFNGKKCCICGEPAKARIYSTKGTCVNERYCLKCYRETKSLLPLDREKGYKIGV